MISESCDDNHDDLLKKFSGDEMLEEDVAAERENRKEANGFVTPSSAAVFLHQSRSTPLKRIVSENSMPHGARQYLGSSEAKNVSVARPKTSGNEPHRAAHKEMVAFMDTLQKTDVLPPLPQQKLGYDGPDFGDIHCPLFSAMRDIKEPDPDLYAKRIIELSDLSNTLISGCRFRGRTFRQKEAAEAALSVCDLGSEYLIGIGSAPKKNRPISESVSAIIRASENKFYPDIAPEFGPDARRFEWGISGIFTARSNAAAGPKDKQDWIKLFFRGPKGESFGPPVPDRLEHSIQ